MAEIISMPKLGFDMAEGTLIRWIKLEGEEIQKGDILADIETDKATVEVESTASGIVYRHIVTEGEIVPVGNPIAVIAAVGEEVPESELPVVGQTEGAGEKSLSEEAQQEGTVSETVPEEPEEVTRPSEGRIRASPLAKRVAEEHGIDLNMVKGSGTGGRIVRRDIEAAMDARAEMPKIDEPKQALEPTVSEPQTFQLQDAADFYDPKGVPDDQSIKLNRLRSAIGRRMVQAKQQVPHFYITRSYDTQALLDIRKQVNALLSEEDKTSVNDFVIKAVALSLRKYPNINASFKGDEILLHGHINIGVAVALEGGLMTVVVRDADRKPIRLISKEVREMVSRARSGRVQSEDIEGSTFSISNLGMYDVEHFVAIINPPEAAILAVATAQRVPVVVGDELKPGVRMKATISADHRVTDGAEAAEFMKSLGDFLENPMSLLL